METKEKNTRKVNYKKGELRSLIFKFLKKRRAKETTTEQIWAKFKIEHPEVNHSQWKKRAQMFFHPEEFISKKNKLVTV